MTGTPWRRRLKVIWSWAYLGAMVVVAFASLMYATTR